jgi:hypothetical protein
MCLTKYGASEAVNLCRRYAEKSTKYSEQKCAITLENKIIWGLTFLCASSFRPSHRSICRQVSHPCDAYSDGYQSHSDAERRPSGGATNLRRGRTISSR